MKSNLKLSKTFVLFLKKKEKEGYLRFKSHQNIENEITFSINVEKTIKKASIFVNYDKVKKLSLNLIEKYNFDEVKIIDTKTSKIFYVKKENKKIKTKSQV